MECIHCKGKMERGQAPFHVDRRGYHVQWDKVPAWVCAQCGEAYFEPHEVELIQKALLALEREGAGLAAS